MTLLTACIHAVISKFNACHHLAAECNGSERNHWRRLRCMALLAKLTPASQEPGSSLVLNSVQAC
jgi:hypothetical protein